MPESIEQNQVKEAIPNEGASCANACLDEIFGVRPASKPAPENDVSKEVKDAATEVGAIIASAENVQAAAENPDLVRLLTDAKRCGTLDQVVQLANEDLQSKESEIRHSIKNDEFYGVLITQAHSPDNIKSVPSDAGPMAEDELAQAAKQIADNVLATKSFGNKESRAAAEAAFGRAGDNGQLDDLLARINGDNLGDADILGTHQFVSLAGGSMDKQGKIQLELELVFDDVAKVNMD